MLRERFKDKFVREESMLSLVSMYHPQNEEVVGLPEDSLLDQAQVLRWLAPSF